jgi:hypothetical protein
MLIFISILLMTTNIKTCPAPQVIYKYVPRTFDEDQAEPAYVSDIFKNMFSHQSPWVYSVNNIDREKQEEINKFFISQY